MNRLRSNELFDDTTLTRGGERADAGLNADDDDMDNGRRGVGAIGVTGDVAVCVAFEEELLPKVLLGQR